MADTPEGGNNNGGDTPPATDEFKPITSQDDLNRILEDRLKRERSKFADYKDLKAKASRLDEMETANLSELEKANGRATTAETERDAARAEAIRLRIAVSHGIGLEDADLFLTGSDEETLTAQAKRLIDRDSARKKTNHHVPREGATSPNVDTDEREAARSLFGG